jgi:predicted lysophospholipase L1 biosynthesis ABC-type transport system permease subunit
MPGFIVTRHGTRMWLVCGGAVGVILTAFFLMVIVLETSPVTPEHSDMVSVLNAVWGIAAVGVILFALVFLPFGAMALIVEATGRWWRQRAAKREKPLRGGISVPGWRLLGKVLGISSLIVVVAATAVVANRTIRIECHQKDWTPRDTPFCTWFNDHHKLLLKGHNQGKT